MLKRFEKMFLVVAVVVTVGLVSVGRYQADQRAEIERLELQRQRVVTAERNQRLAVVALCDEYVALRQAQRERHLEQMLGRYGFKPGPEFDPGPEESWAAQAAAQLRAARFMEITADELAVMRIRITGLLEQWKEVNSTVSADMR